MFGWGGDSIDLEIILSYSPGVASYVILPCSVEDLQMRRHMSLSLANYFACLMLESFSLKMSTILLLFNSRKVQG